MSSDELSSVENKHTRRAAAKKASKLAAKQLESSPIRSEDERGRPSFGEPSRPKAHVKVTYAAKKSKSPTKSSPLSKPLFQTPTKRVAQTPSASARRSRSQPASARKRKGPKSEPRPSTSTKINAVLVESDLSEEETHHVQATPSRARNSLSGRKSAPSAGTKAKNTRKRKRSPSPLEGGEQSEAESALTELSSEAENASHSFATNGHVLPSASRPGTPGGEDKERTLGVGDLVWVRLNMAGKVSEEEETIWWPSKVVSSNPLKLSLFGEGPKRQGQDVPEITISTTSHRVILPMLGPHKLRFHEKTCMPTAATEDLAKSPRKKHRSMHVDIIERWKEARDEMLQAYEDANDGFPLFVSFYKSPSKPAVQSTPHRPRSSVSSESEDNDQFVDPGPEVTWDIPGETVLAKDRRQGTQYWPAKVMRYIARTHPNDKEKYEVLYFDKTSKIIPREMIVCAYEAEFTTCQMGDSRDNYALDMEPPNSDEEDLRPLPDENLNDEKLRAQSPTPHIPILAVDFVQLTIAEQLEYVKPVLSALLNGQYLPARGLHIGFMKGGKSRTQVTASAWKRGDVSHKDKEELSTCIRRWMARREKRQALGVVPHDAQLPDDDPAAAADNQSTRVSDQDSLNGEVVPPLPASQTSTINTERAPSSAAEEPPSSFIDGTTLEDDSMSTELEDHKDPVGNAHPEQPASGLASQKDDGNPLHEHMETKDVKVGSVSVKRLPTYATLSDLDKITYCTSVLLPEAILQLLLWRNGLRDTPTLLSQAREQQLHEEAVRLASATYWVHDIVLLKRSAGRNMLPQYQEEPGVVYSSTGRTKRKSRHD